MHPFFIGVILFLLFVIIIPLKPTPEEKVKSSLLDVQTKECKLQGGQVQFVNGSDNLCWKDGRVILVINGE